MMNGFYALCAALAAWWNSSYWDFFGHGIFPNGLVVNLIGVLFPFMFLYLYLKAQKARRYLGMFFYGWLFLLTLPHTTYLACEIKHVLFLDGIADGSGYFPVAVFLGLSIVGFISNILVILHAMAKVQVLSRYRKLSITFLGFISSIGAYLGLQEINSIDGVLRPGYVLDVGLARMSQGWIVFIVVLGLTVSLVTLNKYVPSSRQKKLSF